MKKNGLLAILAASLSISATTFAAIPVPFGWYLGGNVGGTNVTNKTYPGSADTKGVGWSVNGGYKFSPYVGGEVGYTYYAKTHISNAAGTTAATDQHYSYDIAGKLMLPIDTTGLEVFGKLGVGRGHSYLQVTNAAAAGGMSFYTGSHSTTGPYLGAGADYAVSSNFAANLQWARQVGRNATGNLDLYSLGASWIF